MIEVGSAPKECRDHVQTDDLVQNRHRHLLLASSSVEVTTFSVSGPCIGQRFRPIQEMAPIAFQPLALLPYGRNLDGLIYPYVNPADLVNGPLECGEFDHRIIGDGDSQQGFSTVFIASAGPPPGRL